MNLNINHIGQIALVVADVDRAEEFFGKTLGFRKLFRFGDLCFFDCAGVPSMISTSPRRPMAFTSAPSRTPRHD